MSDCPTVLKHDWTNDRWLGLDLHGYKVTQLRPFPNCPPFPAQRGKCIFLFVCLETKVFFFSVRVAEDYLFTQADPDFSSGHTSHRTKRGVRGWGIASSPLSYPGIGPVKLWTGSPHAELYISFCAEQSKADRGLPQNRIAKKENKLSFSVEHQAPMGEASCMVRIPQISQQTATIPLFLKAGRCAFTKHF